MEVLDIKQENDLLIAYIALPKKDAETVKTCIWRKHHPSWTHVSIFLGMAVDHVITCNRGLHLIVKIWMVKSSTCT